MYTRLRLLRTSMKLTQDQAAIKVGISRGWYSLIESGRLQATENIKAMLAEVFEQPAADLLKPVTIRQRTKTTK